MGERPKILRSLLDPATQHVVRGPAAWPSPERWLEIESLSPRPGPAESAWASDEACRPPADIPGVRSTRLELFVPLGSRSLGVCSEPAHRGPGRLGQAHHCGQPEPLPLWKEEVTVTLTFRCSSRAPRSSAFPGARHSWHCSPSSSNYPPWVVRGARCTGRLALWLLWHF